MQDIRKPYSRSKSNKALDARVVAFEQKKYEEEERISRSARDEHPREGRTPRFSESDISIYPRRQISPIAPRKKRSLESYLFGGLIAAIVLFVGLYTYVFDSATITITPKYADVTISSPITFDSEGKAAVTFALATTTLQKTKTLPQSEAKKVETKAQGTVIVYNKFDTAPQRLLKNTRFESTDGKIYRINDSITIPGMKGDTPGSIQVTVYADSYGEDYNIPPTDFTIPGFKGSPRFQGFFARSVGPMTGGASGNKKLVSPSDLAAAKDELALSLTQDLKAALKKVTQDGYVPLYSAIQVQFTDNEKDVLAGNTATYNVTGIGYLALANESELASAIIKTQGNLSQYKNDALRLDHTENLTFSLRDETDISKDTHFDVLVDGSPRIVWNVDQKEIIQSLLGKDKSEFAQIMNGYPAIEKAEHDISPAWVSHFPDAIHKITILEKLPALAK